VQASASIPKSKKEQLRVGLTQKPSRKVTIARERTTQNRWPRNGNSTFAGIAVTLSNPRECPKIQGWALASGLAKLVLAERPAAT
jgi:hypothetical protein